MENSSNRSPEEVILNSSGKKKISKQDNGSKRWCFTINNYTEKEYESLVCAFNSEKLKYIIGKEIGTENKIIHLQGFVEFSKRTRLTACKKYNSRAHWEIAKGTDIENYQYCSKDGNFIHKKMDACMPVKTLSPSQLYEWQVNLINIINKEPDDRLIYWYWSKEGKLGKTSFAKYLSIYYDAIPIEGKKNDILFCASLYESRLYIFDFERTMEDFVSYGAIEKVKNGYYMSGKYESKPVIRNSPHIICFANFEPDYESLSKDRWIVVELQ